MQLVVRINNRWSPVKALFFGRTHRGDIVEALPDSHKFSKAELTNQDWRIFKIPGYTVSEAQTLARPEMPTNPKEKFKWKRLRYLDLDDTRMPAALSAYIADNTRQQAIFTVTNPKFIRRIIKTKKFARLI